MKYQVVYAANIYHRGSYLQIVAAKTFLRQKCHVILSLRERLAGGGGVLSGLSHPTSHFPTPPPPPVHPTVDRALPGAGGTVSCDFYFFLHKLTALCTLQKGDPCLANNLCVLSLYLKRRRYSICKTRGNARHSSYHSLIWESYNRYSVYRSCKGGVHSCIDWIKIRISGK